MESENHRERNMELSVVHSSLFLPESMCLIDSRISTSLAILKALPFPLFPLSSLLSFFFRNKKHRPSSAIRRIHHTSLFTDAHQLARRHATYDIDTRGNIPVI